MKYKRLKDYEGIEVNPDKEILKFACCDCGCVHKIALAKENNGNIGIALRRDNRATAQLRRYEFGYLHKGIAGYRLSKEDI